MTLHRRLTDDVKVTESDIVRRVKNERQNKGRMYFEYLKPSERAKWGRRNQVGRDF